MAGICSVVGNMHMKKIEHVKIANLFSPWLSKKILKNCPFPPLTMLP
jgi:hypothetical protein